MKQTIVTFAAVYALIIGATSCGSGGGGSTSVPVLNNGSYKQIERLARPAVKEATQSFAQHDDTNRTSPDAQPYSSQSLYQAIGSFVTGTAGRRADYASTIQSVLIPDEISVDLSQNTTTAAYLGVETKGATGSLYGGRALTDDVIDTDLYVIFGTALTDLNIVKPASQGGPGPDGKQSPCLTTDNVAVNAAAKHFSATFPYVGTPN